MDIKSWAERNLAILQHNPYPGRGIILGMDKTMKYLIQIYWIMGRSANSRNRVLVSDNNKLLKTEAADPAKVEDPSLIIYNAMDDDFCNFVVSNGHQTNNILSHCSNNFSMSNYIQKQDWKFKYEPDEPNFTPRISGLIVNLSGRAFAEILMLKKSPFSDACHKQLYRFDELLPGYGYCVTTYEGDGNPLPSFKGEPGLLPLNGSPLFMAEEIWRNLNKENRVSLAVKAINIKTGERKIDIINQYQSVK